MGRKLGAQQNRRSPDLLTQAEAPWRVPARRLCDTPPAGEDMQRAVRRFRQALKIRG